MEQVDWAVLAKSAWDALEDEEAANLAAYQGLRADIDLIANHPELRLDWRGPLDAVRSAAPLPADALSTVMVGLVIVACCVAGRIGRLDATSIRMISAGLLIALQAGHGLRSDAVELT
jgi:hypothetical protein